MLHRESPPRPPDEGTVFSSGVRRRPRGITYVALAFDACSRSTCLRKKESSYSNYDRNRVSVQAFPVVFCVS